MARAPHVSRPASGAARKNSAATNGSTAADSLKRKARPVATGRAAMRATFECGDNNPFNPASPSSVTQIAFTKTARQMCEHVLDQPPRARCVVDGCEIAEIVALPEAREAAGIERDREHYRERDERTRQPQLTTATRWRVDGARPFRVRSLWAHVDRHVPSIFRSHRSQGPLPAAPMLAFGTAR